MNLKKVCCICVLFSLLAGCASESPIDEKKKKTQTTQISINKNVPQQLTDKDLYGNETTLAVSEEDIQAEKTEIPNEFVSSQPVRVLDAECIPDAYEAFLHEQEAGNILLLDYAHFASDPEKFAKKRAWLEKAISEEIRKKAIWKAPDSDCARYYRENYPEIWEHTLEEVIFHGKPEN